MIAKEDLGARSPAAVTVENRPNAARVAVDRVNNVAQDRFQRLAVAPSGVVALLSSPALEPVASSLIVVGQSLHGPAGYWVLLPEIGCV